MFQHFIAREGFWYLVMDPTTFKYFIILWRNLPRWVEYAGLEYQVHDTEREARDAAAFIEDRFGYTQQ